MTRSAAVARPAQMGSRSARLVCAIAMLAATPAAADHGASAAPPPWQRTEVRQPCAGFDVLRRPHFGDTHVHTANSIDAIVFNTLNTPRDAYRFANGEALGLAPFDAQGNPAHTIQLGRPLDFAAVTDHAEGFGSQSVCFQPGLPGYDSTLCDALRQASVSGSPALVQPVFFGLILPQVVADPGTLEPSVCGPAPAYADCASRQSVIWLDNQDAAEEFYDRSAACSFTTFVGYEWSGTPGLANLHRNVIFRNDVVPALPVSYIDESKPQNLWAALRAQCQDALPGCDWLAIPHNSNLSGALGLMFQPVNADGSPLTAAGAATRAAAEPLAEVFQAKGSSECRPGVDSTDEQCGFELVHRVTLQGIRNPAQPFPRLSFVRNALKEGLLQEASLGVNPFRLGLVGSTDTHNAIAGSVREDVFFGNSGVNDDVPARGQLGLTGLNQRADHNPGALAVLWAEENTRDALFAAMRRREAYATSGPRHLVRFFAGKLPPNLCRDRDLVARAYRKGAPMGAEIGPVREDGESPTFVVSALKDPGDPGRPGAPLQRIQIVKGWVDESGEAKEKVFEVAGDPSNGADVDLATCTPSGTGFDDLCATWSDPEFDAGQRAFYYARVLENPTCRWSTHVCNQNAIDCSDPASVPPAFAACCDATVPKTIQERSWTSPIWYRPEAFGRVKGTIRFGKKPGTDDLKVIARLGGGVHHDLATQDLRVVVRDDDDILDVTIPAGTLKNGRVQNFAGLKLATFRQEGTGPARLVLMTRPMDLARAHRSDHMVEVELRIGPTFVTSQSRLWTFTGKALESK